MSRFFEEAQERRLHEYVAGELGVPVAVLDAYPYQLEENASKDGLVYNWRVCWEDVPPQGVTAFGPERHQWSDINVKSENDGSPQERDPAA